jgi:3-oxoacyl-[acyl-carrier protein] reductase
MSCCLDRLSINFVRVPKSGTSGIANSPCPELSIINLEGDASMINRTFLVTGATKGIGLALSTRLADAGHHVVGIARDQPQTFPGTFVSADLSDDKASALVFADLATRYSFDGVVNNAGIAKLQRLGEIDLDLVDQILSFNLHPSINAVQAVLPTLREKGWGRIVNVTSFVMLGMINRSAYAASKAALTSLTRTWALELAETGITVNSVAPGPVGTEMLRRSMPTGSEAERAFLAYVPMKRLGTPEEIAAAIAFLLSGEASYITGQTLFVDGGGSLGKSAM